ncbi:MAG TPA: SIMPL domain-containing protein [Methyloceanibacter sp.]|jgi:hypothetical protein
MAPTRKTGLFALYLIASLAAFTPALASDDEPQKRTVSVTGTGTIKLAPDIVSISTGVESDAPAAKDALAKNVAAMTKVIEELKLSGIEAKDIQTTNFSVELRYENRDDGRPAKLTGYRVTNSVYITVRDIGKLGEVLDKVVSLGANSIGGISFGVANREAVENEARKLAMADAIAKAKLYAEAGGAELGEVMTINEQGGFQPYYEKRAAAPIAAQAPVPIEAGTESVSMQVSVTWELK